MWKSGWRDKVLTDIEQHTWDLLVIGGGVMGAGIFLRAVRAGLKVLLLEAKDFAFGASGRSTKLIHGNLESLLNKQYGTARVSVREREWLLKQAPGLVTELEFSMPYYKSMNRSRRQFHQAMITYDLLGKKWKHQSLSSLELIQQTPYLQNIDLLGGYQYFDAQVDDARLVLRLLQEGMDLGGTAINYAPVNKLLRTQSGSVCGAIFSDKSFPKGADYAVEAKIVINATGTWSDEFRKHVGGTKRLLQCKNAHLVFSHEKFPVQHAITLFHPVDHRMIFAVPWEGVTLVGPSNHISPGEEEIYQDEPCATRREIDYLLEGLHFVFPSLDLSEEDILSTFSGLCSVPTSDKTHSVRSVQDFQILNEEGLLTLMGGSFTTFSVVAENALQIIKPLFPQKLKLRSSAHLFNPLVAGIQETALDDRSIDYLLGRYGNHLTDLIEISHSGELDPVTSSLPNIWAELRWAAQSEAVIHLEDLLLRRVRLGLLLANGGQGIMEDIRRVVQPELGWNDAKWKLEVNTYQNIWNRSYSPQPLG